MNATDDNKAKYTATQIAEWFIGHNQKLVDENEADFITNLKLQKLLYYAQGASLALNKYPLFSEPLEAWNYGPVVRSVYNAYKEFGKNGINPQSVDIGKTELDTIDNALLSGIYDKYNKYSATELSRRTHSEKPWMETARNEEIPLSAIEDFFANGEYAAVLTGQVFDGIPVVEPLYERPDGTPVYPNEFNE